MTSLCQVLDRLRAAKLTANDETARGQDTGYKGGSTAPN